MPVDYQLTVLINQIKVVDYIIFRTFVLVSCYLLHLLIYWPDKILAVTLFLSGHKSSPSSKIGLTHARLSFFAVREVWLQWMDRAHAATKDANGGSFSAKTHWLLSLHKHHNNERSLPVFGRLMNGSWLDIFEAQLMVTGTWVHLISYQRRKTGKTRPYQETASKMLAKQYPVPCMENFQCPDVNADNAADLIQQSRKSPFQRRSGYCSWIATDLS